MSAIERTGATHALVIFADIAEEQKDHIPLIGCHCLGVGDVSVILKPVLRVTSIKVWPSNRAVIGHIDFQPKKNGHNHPLTLSDPCFLLSAY
jgi:hypothetical protein